MKLKVKLSESDIAYIDSYVASKKANSRSEVIQKAVRLMQSIDLATQYQSEWQAWEASEDADLWDGVLADDLLQ